MLFLKRPKPSAIRPVVVLGSSSAEQLDYVFGDNKDYHPFWASSWSARSLNDERRGTYLDKIMRPIDRSAHVFLCFGPNDINFVAQYRANTLADFDLLGHLQTMVRGFGHGRKLLRRLGFRSITALFAAPPVELPPPFWIRKGVNHQLPTLMRAKMFVKLAQDVESFMPCVNLIADLAVSVDNPTLAPAYARDRRDSHPNYVTIAPMVWAAIQGMPGMLPHRDPFHTEIYPHKPSRIGELKAAGLTRARTSC